MIGRYWPNSGAIYDGGFAGAGTPPEPPSSLLRGGGGDLDFAPSSTIPNRSRKTFASRGVNCLSASCVVFGSVIFIALSTIAR